MKKILAILALVCTTSMGAKGQAITFIADEAVCEMIDQNGHVIFSTPIYTGAYDRPKMNEGDLRMPWGRYVGKGKPFFRSYLGNSLQVNYPNEYDHFFGHTGSGILVHWADTAAGAPSAGCFVIYDSQKCDEVIRLVDAGVPVYAFPCRMTQDATTLLQGMADESYSSFIYFLQIQYLQIYKEKNRCDSRGNPFVFESLFTLKKDNPESFRVDSVFGVSVVEMTTSNMKIDLSFVGVGSISIERIIYASIDDVVAGAHSRRSRMQFVCEIPNAFFDSLTFKSHRTGKFFASLEKISGHRFHGEISLEELEGMYLGKIVSRYQKENFLGFFKEVSLASTTETPVPTAMVVTFTTQNSTIKLIHGVLIGDSLSGMLTTGERIQIPLVAKEGRFFKSSGQFIICEIPQEMGCVLEITCIVGNREEHFLRLSGEKHLFLKQI